MTVNCQTEILTVTARSAASLSAGSRRAQPRRPLAATGCRPCFNILMYKNKEEYKTKNKMNVTIQKLFVKNLSNPLFSIILPLKYKFSFY